MFKNKNKYFNKLFPGGSNPPIWRAIWRVRPSGRRGKWIVGVLAGGVLALGGGVYIAAQNGWFGGGASIPEDTMTRGLAGSWNFDEGNGQAANDASGNGNSGTLGSSAIADSADPEWVTGKNAGALQFDGKDDYVNAGNPTNLKIAGSVSIEAWINTAQIDTSSYMHGVVSKDQYLLRSRTNKISMVIHDETGYPALLGNTSLVANRWYHVVAVYDGNTMSLYLNGVSDATPKAVGTITTNDNDLIIGNEPNQARYWKGLIDDVHIYSRALTAAEIKYHYNQGGPVGYWKFDEGSGLKARDASGNNNDGTILGATWADGKYGSALSFDGMDDYVTAGNGSSLNITKAITMSLWLKRNSVTADTYQGIIQKEGAGGYVLSLNYASGDNKISFIAPTVSYRKMSTAITDTNWHHIVCAMDENSDSLKFYIDGKLDSTQTSAGTLAANAGSLNFGLRTDYFDGLMDEVKIYNYVRTADEIRLDYQAGMATHLGPSGKTCSQDPASCMSKGLVGYWDMNEGGGTTAKDKSGNGNNGTLTNGSKWVSGKKVGAIQLDGKDDYVNCGSSSSLNSTNAVTAAAWVKTNTTSGSRFIMTKWNGFSLESVRSGWCAKGCINITIDGTGRIVNFNTDHKDGKWHYLVASYDSATRIINLYFDGKLDNTLTLSGLSSYEIQTSNNSLNIGNYLTSYFNGSIDDVRVYNRALSPEEVRYQYNEGGPVGYWKLDEGSGLKARDESGNNNDGTLTGFTSTDTGTAEAGAGTTLTDNDKAWTVNQWTNGTIAITAGTGSGQTRVIAGNTATVITVSLAWTANPDATSVYSLTQASAWTDGKYGGAIQLDGKDDVIDVGTNNSIKPTKDITLEFWVKPGASQNSFADIYGNHVGGGFVVQQNASQLNKFYFAYWNGSSHVGTGLLTQLNTGEWNHFVVQKNGTVLRHYLDGVFIGQTSVSGDIVYAANQHMYIGNGYTGLSRVFNGLIDEVRVYDYARAADEIRLDYQAGMAAHLGPSGQACAQDPASCMSKGLVGYWDMNEGSGLVAKDKSGNGNNGVFNSRPGWIDGKNGGALNFDGKDDYLDCGNGSSFNITDDISLEAWVAQDFTSSIASDFKFIMKNSSYIFYDPWGLPAARSAFWIDGAWRYSNVLAVNPKQWYHIVSSYSSSDQTIRLYVNGVPLNPVTLSGLSTYKINISANNVTLGNGILGKKNRMDDVRIYNRVLSPEEVRYHYNQGEPVGWWKMDEGKGTKAFDASGNNNKGILGDGTCQPGSGTCPSWVAGKTGSALSFDGIDDYVNCGTNSKLDVTDGISIGAWINPITLGESQAGHIVSRGNTAGWLLYLYGSQTLKFFGSSATISAVSNTNSIVLNRWQYVEVVYDKQNIKFYIDGKLNSTTPETDGLTNIGSCLIGSRSVAGDYDFNGQIDDVKIYNYARTAEQIKTDYNAGTATHLK